MRKFIPFLLAVLLAACSTSGPPPGKEMSFTRYQPIHVDVENIQIIEEYKSPMRDPNVEHLLPVSPAEAMRIWVKDRIRAVGGTKTLEVIIKDASVVSTQLPGAGVDVFTNSRDRRYDARLAVEMRIYGGRAMSNVSIQVHANRYLAISEKASLAEREAIFRKMIADLMESINGQLEKNMFAYFKDYIVYSANP